MTHVIPFGTSEPQKFQLLDQGQPIDGTGITLGIEIVTMARRAIPTPLTVAWDVIADGKIVVTGTETLPLGKYYVRYKLTDGNGKIGYAPNQGSADIWNVVRVASK